MTVLHVLDARKAYGAHVLFDDVTFEVPQGAATALVGPNGAGKSTLLRCLLGMEGLDHGSIEVQGCRVDERDPAFRAAVAASIEDLSAFPDLSVAEHLDLLACAHDLPDAGDRVDEVLLDVGLDTAADQLPVTLSSGQRRRLALASCFVRPRRLLVLDEPEQRLDVAGRAWLAQRLCAEKADGVAIVFACHDDAIVDAVADHVVQVGT